MHIISDAYAETAGRMGLELLLVLYGIATESMMLTLGCRETVNLYSTCTLAVNTGLPSTSRFSQSKCELLSETTNH